MKKRREPVPLLFSIVFHVVAAFAILNAAFYYDLSGLRDTTPKPQAEEVTYVSVRASGGGKTGGADSTVAAAKSTAPVRDVVAPVEVPQGVTAPPAGGAPGGVDGGRGRAREVTAVTGVVPSDPDPRLEIDPHAFYPAPKTHAERVDSAVKASIYAYNDSVAQARANAGRAPGDWTFEKGGKKWGIDGNKIYLGKFAIPSAVLAALPIRIQGNPSEAIADRLSSHRRADLLLHAESQLHEDEFKSAVRRIRERKEKERAERSAAEENRPIP